VKRYYDEEDIEKTLFFTPTHQVKDIVEPIIHILGYNEDVDAQGVQRRNKKKSPYDLCQTFINQVSRANWLIMTNGKIIRLLTKYYHSYSEGYVEFNLENMLETKDEKELLLLYNLIHVSSFFQRDKEHSRIITLQQRSMEQGVKVGEYLRNTFKEVIEIFGDELIHQNQELKIALQEKQISPKTIYHTGLSKIFHIIFCQAPSRPFNFFLSL